MELVLVKEPKVTRVLQQWVLLVMMLMRVVGSALESPGFGSTFFVISIVFFCFFHCCLVLKKRKTLTEKNGVLSMEKGLKTREIKGGQKW